MIRFVTALLLVQTFYCVEFPELENHIKLVWKNVCLEQKFDGSQTRSDKDGNVDGFILCAMFKNGDDNGDCSYDYEYSEQTPFGTIISDSGSGTFIAKFVSKDDDNYSCLKFFNPIEGFKEVYEKTLVKEGSWRVDYDCKKYIVEKDYTWIIVGVIVGALVIVFAVFGIMCLKKERNNKKKKNDYGNEGTTYGSALLQNT